jgi:hypothetical protein
MDYLTRFYKNQSEILAEKVKVLEEMLLSEASPPDRNFRKGDTSQSAWSTSELESRAGKIKKGGIFQQVDDKDQSQEWKDIQAELASRKSASTSKNTTNQTTSSSGSMPSQKTAATPNNQVAADGTPILLQRVPGQPDSGWNRPRTTPMPPNQPPHPMDLSGVKAPGTKPKPKPTQQQRSGPNSPDVEAERARLFSGMVKDTLNTAGQKDKFDTSLSLSGSSTSKPQNKTQPWDGGAQTSAMAQNLLNQMNSKAQQAATTGSGSAKSAPSTPIPTPSTPGAAKTQPATVVATSSQQMPVGSGKTVLGRVQTNAKTYDERKAFADEVMGKTPSSPQPRSARERQDTILGFNIPGLEDYIGPDLRRAGRNWSANDAILDTNSGDGGKAAYDHTKEFGETPEVEIRRSQAQSAIPGSQERVRTLNYGFPKVGSGPGGLATTQDITQAQNQYIQNIAGSFTQRDVAANAPSDASQVALQKYRQDMDAMLKRGKP